MDYTKFIIFLDSENVYLKIPLFLTNADFEYPPDLKRRKDGRSGSVFFAERNVFVCECFISSDLRNGST